jgi:predicted RNase H-like HicB family nuclease
VLLLQALEGVERPMEVAVRATWDREASVWVAESDDVPGLVTEADDIEALVAKLKVLIPELLDANGVVLTEQDEVAFLLTASRHERAERHAA